MQLDSATFALVGTAIGAIAGIGGTVATTIITQRGEAKRHRKELAMNTALAYFRELHSGSR